MVERGGRVLIAGRSAQVLVDAVGLLRERGYGANASNQFDRLLDDYDVREVDLVIFGGMVPPATKQRLQAEIRELNPRVSFLQGLGGIAPLLVAQVEQFFEGAVPDVRYDAATRTVRIGLSVAASVVVEALWAAFTPEPVARSAIVVDGELAAGVHEIVMPVEVPVEGSYVTVRVGPRVCDIQIGETPRSVRRIAASGGLPASVPVTTRHRWD